MMAALLYAFQPNYFHTDHWRVASAVPVVWRHHSSSTLNASTLGAKCYFFLPLCLHILYAATTLCLNRKYSVNEWSTHSLWLKLSINAWMLYIMYYFGYMWTKDRKSYAYFMARYKLEKVSSHANMQRSTAVSSLTVQVRLRAEGWVGVGGDGGAHTPRLQQYKMTCFTQSSPYFGCKLNVGFGLRELSR